jgi:glucose-6-phosphate 1-dehydrogenase
MTTLAVLGASGDMARRLLFPALMNLEAHHRLGDLRIVGYALEDWTEEEFVRRVKESLDHLSRTRRARSIWNRFSHRLSYCSGDLSEKQIEKLKTRVEGDAAFYLALPPGMFAEAAASLAAAGLNRSDRGWRRVVIEKPFGVDLESAEQLNRRLHESWSENQIFRIDHYLGKETVQNILVFRFGNRFLDPILNSNHVDFVQITAAETLGLEGRYRYYDNIGALRDMLQSHLMQLTALTAMEPPSIWNPDVIHDHKVDVLRSIRPITPDDVPNVAVRGQYTRGFVDGEEVAGYKEESGGTQDSSTETFAALKLFIDNWRWAGVPFYVRSGKRLGQLLTEVAIHLRAPPLRLFHGSDMSAPINNRLVFRLRPSESISLLVRGREPGLEMESRELALRADYAHDLDADSDSYCQLILDVLDGDRTPFLRFDEVEWAWRVLSPVLDAWKTGEPEPYVAGSDGPSGQRNLTLPGHAWSALTAANPAALPADDKEKHLHERKTS